MVPTLSCVIFLLLSTEMQEVRVYFLQYAISPNLFFMIVDFGDRGKASGRYIILFHVEGFYPSF